MTLKTETAISVSAEPCDLCDGTALIDCLQCAGDGRIAPFEEPSRSCPSCGGTGVAGCPECCRVPGRCDVPPHL